MKFDGCFQEAQQVAGQENRIVAALVQDECEEGVLKFMENSQFLSLLEVEQILYVHTNSNAPEYLSLKDKYYAGFGQPMDGPCLFLLNGCRKVYDMLGLGVSSIQAIIRVRKVLQFACGWDISASNLKSLPSFKGCSEKTAKLQVWRDPAARDSSTFQDFESHPGCSKGIRDNPEIDRAFHLAGGSGRIVAILAEDNEDDDTLKCMNNSNFRALLHLEQVIFFCVTPYDNFFYTLSEKYYEIFAVPMMKPNLFFMNGTRKIYDILGVNVCASDAIIRLGNILHVYSELQDLYAPITKGLPPFNPKENDSISKSCTVCTKKRKYKHGIQEVLSLAGGTGRIAAILVAGGSLKGDLDFMKDKKVLSYLALAQVIFYHLSPTQRYYKVLSDKYQNIYYKPMTGPNLFLLSGSGKIYDILGAPVSPRDAKYRIRDLIQRYLSGQGIYVPPIIEIGPNEDHSDSDSEFQAYYYQIKPWNISEALQWAGGSGNIVAALATCTPGDSLQFIDDPVFGYWLYYGKIIYLQIDNTDEYFSTLSEIYYNIFHETIQSPILFFLNAGGKVYDILGGNITEKEAIKRVLGLIELCSNGNSLYVASQKQDPVIPEIEYEESVTSSVDCEFSDIQYPGVLNEACLLSRTTGRIVAILMQDDSRVKQLDFMKDPVVRSYLKLDQIIFWHSQHNNRELKSLFLTRDCVEYIELSMPRLYLVKCDGDIFDHLGTECTPKEARIRIKAILQQYARGEHYHVPRLDGLPNFDPDRLDSGNSHSAQKRGINQDSSQNQNLQVDEKNQCGDATRYGSKRSKKSSKRRRTVVKREI